jgi:hypothetical protein
MKKIFFSVLIVFSVTAASAQTAPEKDYSVNAGVDFGYATGRFNYAPRLGYGISVEGSYSFADNSSFTVNTGYTYFANKVFAATDSVDADMPTDLLVRFAAVPLLLGVKIDNEGKFYVHPQFGLMFRTGRHFISATYGLGVGMVTSRHADFSFRFQVVQKKTVIASFFAVRAAYVF